MKRLLSALALSAVLAVSLSFAAVAQEGHGMKMEKGESMKKDDAPKTMTVTGEIVDMGCYMGHGAKGAGPHFKPQAFEFLLLIHSRGIETHHGHVASRLPNASPA